MSIAPCLDSLRDRCEKFLQTTGRRPRILLSHMNDEASSMPLKALAGVFADAGFDVDIGPCSSSPAAIAKMACENDVHVLGIFGRPGDQAVLIRDFTDALAQWGDDSIKIYMGREKVDDRLLEKLSDFERMALGSAKETLALIGA